MMQTEKVVGTREEEIYVGDIIEGNALTGTDANLTTIVEFVVNMVMELIFVRGEQAVMIGMTSIRKGIDMIAGKIMVKMEKEDTIIIMGAKVEQ